MTLASITIGLREVGLSVHTRTYFFRYHLEMDVPQILRDARQRAGLSQRDLAYLAGTSQPAVARYERGVASPSLATLQRLLSALDLELNIGPRPRDLRSVGPMGRRAHDRRSQLLRILDEHGARRPLIFGSVARGDDHEGSDLDLLVEMDRPTLVTVAALERELSDAFGAAVDLAVPESLDGDVLRSARRAAIPL